MTNSTKCFPWQRSNKSLENTVHWSLLLMKLFAGKLPHPWTPWTPLIPRPWLYQIKAPVERKVSRQKRDFSIFKTQKTPLSCWQTLRTHHPPHHPFQLCSACNYGTENKSKTEFNVKPSLQMALVSYCNFQKNQPVCSTARRWRGCRGLSSWQRRRRELLIGDGRQLPCSWRSMHWKLHMEPRPWGSRGPSGCTCVSLPSELSGWTLTPAAGLQPGEINQIRGNQ